MLRNLTCQWMYRCSLVILAVALGAMETLLADAFPRGQGYADAFSQSFRYAPGSEWQTESLGASSFVWQEAGQLRSTLVNNPAGARDEYFRAVDVPVLTPGHDFAFTGTFRIVGSSPGPDDRTAVFWGLGQSGPAAGGLRPGVGIAVEGDASGYHLTIRTWLGGETAVHAGAPVALQEGVDYIVRVSHFIDAEAEWVCLAEVYTASGADPAGTSRVMEEAGGDYAIDRCYLANDPSLTDGGQLTLDWTGVGIEPALLPLHHTPFYQSPVSLGPSDLLQLCGQGLDSQTLVLYQQIEDTTTPPGSPPREALLETAANHGRMTVVSTHGLPRSLVAQAPEVLEPGRSYAIWAGHPDRGWSGTILANDARPLWVTPAQAFAGETVRIIGRNLMPAPGQPAVRVRLSGPAVTELDAYNENDLNEEALDYVTKIDLPGDLPPGEYSLELCRDGLGWVPLAGQDLVVLPPSPAPSLFEATAYGAVPDDGLDDTAAIQAAMAAAVAAGGGEVRLPAGTCHASALDLPAGVDLAGAGLDQSVLADSSPDQTSPPPMLRVHGQQSVHDLQFDDPQWEDRVMDPTMAIELSGDVAGLTIRDCRFLHSATSIGGNPSSVRFCRIDHNEFQARVVAIYFFSPFTDSRIRGNRFTPLPISANDGWTYPSEVTGCLRVDYSENTVDGTVNDGWRNGPFWNMFGNNENLLICRNRLSCTGDTLSETSGYGYGEAIALDGNGNVYPYFYGACVTATPTALTLPAGWPEADVYAGDWVSIVDGPGLGQSRRLTGHGAGDLNTLSVTPPWDVLPGPGSVVTVSRLYKQVYILGNEVDQRPSQRQNNVGEILFFGSIADSVIAQNTAYKSKGILLNLQSFSRDWEHVTRASVTQYFGEVRDNRLEGEWGDPALNPGGIHLIYSSLEGDQCPVIGFGNIIAGNRLAGCDYNQGGAIHSGPGWYTPASPYLVKETLIFDNTLSDAIYGISLAEPFTWDTVIGPNTFTNIGWPLLDRGTGTVMLEDLLAPRTLHVDARVDPGFWYQYGTEQNPFATMQHVFNLAPPPGDTIQVAAGIYHPPSAEVWQGLPGYLHLSGAGMGLTILEGAFQVGAGAGGSLRGFPIRDSNTESVSGIFLSQVDDFTISGNDIHGHLLNGVFAVSARGLRLEGNCIRDCWPAGISIEQSDARIVNNIVYQSRLPDGCGIFVKFASRATIANNTLYDIPNVSVGLQFGSHASAWNNIAALGGGGYGTDEDSAFDFMDANDAWGFAWDDYWGNGAEAGPHGLAADPRFVNPAWGDFRLLRGSACRDAGIPDGSPDADFLGGPRPVGVAWDMGAFESEPVVMADLDEDDRVSPADLIILMVHLAGQLPAGTAPFRAAGSVADVSRDGTIDSVDLVLVNQFLAENQL